MSERLSNVELAYVATFGTLWGVSEITLGFTLHNLHVPFTGLIQTFIGTVIALVTVRLTNRKRALFYTATIAAVQKMLSFTTVKIFPIIGILVSAIIGQSVIYILGINLISFVMAGALMCGWPFVQSLLFYFLTYSTNLIDIYQEFLNRLNCHHITTWGLIKIIIATHLVLGVCAALLAWKIYLSLNRRKEKSPTNLELRTVILTQDLKLPNTQKNVSLPTKTEHYTKTNSNYKSILVLLIIVLTFLLDVKVALVLVFIALLIVLLTEPKISKFFINPGFVIFATVALGSPLLFNLSPKELQINLFILSRGILITLWIYFYTQTFTSSNTYKKIERFLPNELVSLINVSSSIMTVLHEQTSKEFDNIKNEKRSMLERIVNFCRILDKISTTISLASNRPVTTKIIILTGKVHGGKTTFATNIASNLKKSEINVGGILSKAKMSNGEVIAYFVEDIKTGQSRKIITKEKVKKYYVRFRSYFFLRDGMNFALKCLSLEYLKDAKVAVIDEIGAMELENKGYAKQLKLLLGSSIPIIILVIRKQFIEMICQKYNIIPIHTVTVGDNIKTVIKVVQSISSHNIS